MSRSHLTLVLASVGRGTVAARNDDLDEIEAEGDHPE